MQELSEKDNRMHVYHHENHGAGYTRNRGIQLASGKYITFIDSDDYVDIDYLDTFKKSIGDKEHRGKKVFDIFIENGANSDILYLQHPHLGTDKLREIIPVIREKIIKMGGEFRFSTKLTDIKVKDAKVVSVTLNDKETVPCDVLVLAIGHSARDTFHLLDNVGLKMESKPFAVGVRVMHYQGMIDREQYPLLWWSDILHFHPMHRKDSLLMCLCSRLR